MSDRLIKQPSHLDLQFLLEQVGEGYVAKGKSFLKQNPRTKMVELFDQAFYTEFIQPTGFSIAHLFISVFVNSIKKSSASFLCCLLPK